MSRLFVMNGPFRGESFELDKKIVYLGRLSNNDIQIREKTISRRHLRIEKKEDRYVLRDLNSKNGTFIDGTRLRPDTDIEVEEGVPIAVGKIFISLGVRSSEEIFSREEMVDLSDEFSSTAVFTAHKDRPMSPPKNMEFFFKVSNVLNQSLDINRILERMLDYIFDLLKRIDRGVIILVDHETGEYSSVISRSTKNGDNNRKYPLYSKTIVNKVIKSGKAIIMMDTFGQDEADISESMELMKVKSVMCVPLISKSQVRGVIYVDSLKIPYGFREEDLSLLSALSSPAAIAIENALLYSNLEKLIEARTINLRNIEKMLGESEKRFRAMFNNMSSGVIVFKVINNGDDFIILDLNRADCRIEKIRKNDVLGKSILQVFPELRNTSLLEVFRKVWKSGKPEHSSITLSKGKREKNWREYYIYALPDDEIVAIFDDITEKKAAEIEQKALQEQLFASQKMESIGAFAGGTAHNFRNILQAISGNIEYLEMIYGENSEVKELANNIYHSIDKGVELINNLLHFSKTGWKLEMKDLDLSEVINKTHEIVDKVLNKNIEIKTELGENLWVRGNFSLLSQAFMNLFTNARDAMPNGGKLVIKAKKLKNRIMASVSDTGHGIDKDVMDKIFDPFFTLKDVGSGTGLGLSTTHGIIEQHKGTITVSSKPGMGTTFQINLPATKGKPVQESEPPDEIVMGKEQKILIVDDEPPVLDSIAGLVEKLGYRAIPVDKSTEALNHYKKWSPDVVLIDRSMPELDGVACLKRLIATDPMAKIIILSGYDDSGPDGIDDDVKKMIKGYLTKPCGTKELSRAISRVLTE